MKYFRENEGEKKSLSTYLSELEERSKRKDSFYQDTIDVRRVKYLITLFGDIELETDVIYKLISFYSSYGGRYSVRQDDETLYRILDFKYSFPSLTGEALYEMGFYYIKDLFDKYSLKEVFQDFIDIYGMEDETFVKYIDFVDKIADSYQEKFIEEAKEIDYLKDEYGESYVRYLKSLIERKHISKDLILRYLPEASLIKKDEQQLSSLSKKHRIYFGVSYPLSYELMETIIKDRDLSDCSDDFYYYVSTSDLKIPLTFTKKDFIESVKREHKIKKI